MSQFKRGVLTMHHMVEAIHFGTEEQLPAVAELLLTWCREARADLENTEYFPAFSDLVTPLEEALDIHRSEDHLTGQTEESLKALHAPLARLMQMFLSQLTLHLYIGPQNEGYYLPPILAGVPCTNAGDDRNKLDDTHDGRINIMMMPEEYSLTEEEERIDALISSNEVFLWSTTCYPFDLRDYERLYLSGQLAGLRGARNDTALLIAGAGLSAAGLPVEEMQVPVVNTALSSLDPRYCLHIAEKAKSYCKKISNVAICAPHDFWCADYSQSQEAEAAALIRRTLYPVTKKSFQKGAPLTGIFEKTVDCPLVDHVFDLEGCRERLDKIALKDVAELPYFNDKYNAEADAAPPRDIPFSPEAMAEGFERLEAFGEKMRKKGVGIHVIVPPAKEADSQAAACFSRLTEGLADRICFHDWSRDGDFHADDFDPKGFLNATGRHKLAQKISESVV